MTTNQDQTKARKALEPEQIIAMAEILDQEIRKKQEPRPEHLTRLANLVLQLAIHVHDLRQQRPPYTPTP